MKKVLVLLLVVILSTTTNAVCFEHIDGIAEEKISSTAEQTQSDDVLDTMGHVRYQWSKKLNQSPFALGLDLQTKYIWRGMEMMTQNSSPVLFPLLNYSWKGLYVYVMGGYAVNGEYAEVDFGVSYTWNGFTLGFNDYYYPTVDSNKDNYFRVEDTSHWLEATLTYAPEKIPVWITASNFFYGADNYMDENGNEKQAYSSYVELGTYYDFLDNNRVSLAVGAALNKSCYNGYEKDFSICNIEGKYTYNVRVKNDWALPLSVSYIYNPVYDKSFVNFTANIAF